MKENLAVTLSFEGNKTEQHLIDFYDVTQVLLGFQRSLALTTHLVINNEIITQAPSLKGAQILFEPPQAGSWKATGIVVAGLLTGIYYAGTAPKDTPLGHLVHSAYDYVISQSLGFHVDYEKSLGQQYKELRKSDEIPKLDQSRFDSLIEKCQSSIIAMHRPIVGRNTAESARIFSNYADGRPIGGLLNSTTFDYINFTKRTESSENFIGKITSYNKNTYKGRFYNDLVGHPIPFELSEASRSKSNIRKIVNSLTVNALDPNDNTAYISLRAFRNETKTGRLKSLFVIDVS
jgi:hypothetical protein